MANLSWLSRRLLWRADGSISTPRPKKRLVAAAAAVAASSTVRRCYSRLCSVAALLWHCWAVAVPPITATIIICAAAAPDASAPTAKFVAGRGRGLKQLVSRNERRRRQRPIARPLGSARPPTADAATKTNIAGASAGGKASRGGGAKPRRWCEGRQQITSSTTADSGALLMSGPSNVSRIGCCSLG